MSKLKLDASFNDGNYKINIVLELFLWQEDGLHFIYAPALDLTGYGRNEIEAKESLELNLSEFVKYAHAKKTIYDELERLGWTVNKKKKRIHAPDTSDLLVDNESFRDVLTKPGFKKEASELELALT